MNRLSSPGASSSAGELISDGFVVGQRVGLPHGTSSRTTASAGEPASTSAAGSGAGRGAATIWTQPGPRMGALQSNTS